MMQLFGQTSEFMCEPHGKTKAGNCPRLVCASYMRVHLCEKGCNAQSDLQRTHDALYRITRTTAMATNTADFADETSTSKINLHSLKLNVGLYKNQPSRGFACVRHDMVGRLTCIRTMLTKQFAASFARGWSGTLRVNMYSINTAKPVISPCKQCTTVWKDLS